MTFPHIAFFVATFFLGPRCLPLPWAPAWSASTLWLLRCQGPPRGSDEVSVEWGLGVARRSWENLRDSLGKEPRDDNDGDDSGDDGDDDDDDDGDDDDDDDDDGDVDGDGAIRL